MANLNTPSLEELIALYKNQGANVDVPAIGDRAVKGMELQDTILKNKQGQEDRVSALKAKIDAAKKEAAQAQRVQSFRESPTIETATGAFPDVAGKELLGRKPETSNYSKIGETDDEIILADLADPTKQFRVKAPGAGKKGKGADGEKSKLALDIEKERAKVIIGKTKQALEKVGPFTTGVGSLLGNIPATPAKDLKGTVDTIKANLGFEQLAKMRAASPTGGALGQIAVKELEFLQAAVSNLNTDQSEDQVRSNLNEVLTRYQNWLNAVEQTPGNDPNAPPAGIPGTSGLSSEQRRARIAELRAKQAQGTLR